MASGILPEFYMVRHGLTEANIKSIVSGRSESNLAPQGIQQARLTGIFLKGKNLKKIYSSPSLRAQQTCKEMGLSDIPVIYDERLMEMNFGIYDGLPYSSIPEGLHIPDLINNPLLRRPGGETVSEVILRINSFMEDRIAGQNNPIAVVTHGTTGRLILLSLFPSQKNEIMFLKIDNASIWEISKTGFKKLFSPYDPAA